MRVTDVIHRLATDMFLVAIFWSVDFGKFQDEVDIIFVSGGNVSKFCMKFFCMRLFDDLGCQSLCGIN